MRLTELYADPRPVAVARIGLGVAAILMSVEAFGILASIASGRLAAPVFAGVPPLAIPVLLVVLLFQVLAGAAVIAGWKTELAAVVSVLLSIALLLADQQTYSSHRLLATLLLSYLVFARAGTAWSVRPADGMPQVPFWPQLLMMSQLSVVYFFSAISKINPNFASGKPLATWVWIELPWQVYTLAAVMTIAVELVIAIGLWFPATRRLAVALGLGLHLSIVTLMNHDTLALIAFAITCVSLYPLFLTRPGLRQLGRRSRSIIKAGARSVQTT